MIEPGTSALAELRDHILVAATERRPLRLHGGRSKDFLGRMPAGEPLDTRGWRGIVGYEPTELVITARAGTPLAEIEAALAENGQMLAFEPPAFGGQATLGGVVAAGLSGPRRASTGAARDYVLGAALLDGAGRLQRFGGQVMKNVAGYDVSRLLCGSLGTLGLIAEVSLKVLPQPAAEATVTVELDEAEALRRLNQWAGQPLPLSASSWEAQRLHLRLSGARAAVDAALARFAAEVGAQPLDPQQADAHWQAIREQTAAFFVGDAPLWRFSLPSTAPVLGFPGRQLIEWGGAQRWLRADGGTDLDAARLRQAARDLGGSVSQFRGGDRSGEVFMPLAPAVAELHRRIKGEFDPAGIFNPGRMYAGL